MVVYLKSDDHERRCADVESAVQGRISMYRLLRQQREFCGLDPRDAIDGLGVAELELAAHRATPPGTSLHSLNGVALEPIWVIGEDKKDVYFGPASGFATDND